MLREGEKRTVVVCVACREFPVVEEQLPVLLDCGSCVLFSPPTTVVFDTIKPCTLSNSLVVWTLLAFDYAMFGILVVLFYILNCSIAFVLPPELSLVTGLSDELLRTLIGTNPISPRQNNCTVTGILHGPSSLTVRDLEKRNAFVRR